MGRHRQTRALRAAEVAGRCLNLDRVRRNPNEVCNRGPHLRQAPAQPGPRPDDRDVEPFWDTPFAPHAPNRLLEEHAARDPARGLRPRRKEATEITEPGSAEQRVGDGVEDDVTVRVTVQPRADLEGDPTQHEGLARTKRMVIRAETDA